MGCSKRAADEKKTIHFVTWKPNNPAVWDKIINIFEEEHPDMKIEREIGPHSSSAYHDLLTQKLKNRDTSADVFFMDVIWPPEFAAAGWAMPLDTLFPPAEQEKFIPACIMANTYEGKCFGVPVFIDSGVLYYRKDLLAKYGFNPPKTWPEMVAQAAEIVRNEKEENGSDLYGFSGQFKQYEGLVCNMMEYILSNNGKILDEETHRSQLEQKAAIEAVRFVRDQIMGKVAPRGVLTYEEPESLAPFVQGKVVFHRNWPYAWSIVNDHQRSRVADKIGIARLPHFPGGKSYSTLGGWQLGISEYSQNKEAAWIFVQFITSARIQKLLAIEAGLAPSRIQLYQDQEVLKAHPQFAEMKEVFWTAYPRPRTPLYPSVSNILQRYFSKVISSASYDLSAETRTASGELDHIMSITR